jgi:peptide deformylase
MVKEILQIGNPILTQKSAPVTDLASPELKQLIRDLVDTCQETRSITAGLASPQIGGKLAVCVCRRIDLEEKQGRDTLPVSELWEVLINPELKDQSAKKSIIWEACLSVGTGSSMLHGPVARPSKVTVNYTKPDGSKAELSGSGFLAHLIQHEYDHLQGILFLKYVKNPANLWKEADLNKYLDEHDEYPEILS